MFPVAQGKICNPQGEDIKVTSTGGEIRSPRYPRSYPPGKTCIWRLKAPEGFYIRLNITDIEMEGNDDKCYDSLEVRDGFNMSSDALLGRFCQKVVPNNIFSNGRNMSVKFTSDSGGDGRGFAAAYTLETKGTLV